MESPARGVQPRSPKGTCLIEDFHGTPVADPYRWLEELDAPRTIQWVREEGRLAVDCFARLPDRDAIWHRLTDLRNYRRTAVPWREAGRLFFEENRGLEQQRSRARPSPGIASRFTTCTMSRAG